MRFLLDDEQRDFARALDAMLTASDAPGAARAWSRGEPEPGRALWARIAEAGVFALAVPEEFDGLGPLGVELALAFEALGRHAVPGPAVETVATAVLLTELGDAGLAKSWLPRIASGQVVATLRIHANSPYALDADAADAVFDLNDDELRLAAGSGEPAPSLDPVRRLTLPESGGELLATGTAVRSAATRASEWAALATAAQSLGVGRELLARTVAYVQQRRQFGVAIGSFQAVKHRLADVLIALEFAQPLLHAAALSQDGRDIAMAKVATGEAACLAARAALQLHGAIGYTEELDLSLWIRKARPLRDAWGTPAACRARILDAD
ncbi:alkylation response protein AidB-like acyl-CoA dehydrogenase [Streptacidiphilus sp. MAP12-20]|uniref:acyl-CoA dehydrogenase family protein n=1 Tax=Streptacidiphilus sp. MAP12-20 TaxID=3156299 RepID=UPI003517AA2E